MTPNDRNFSGSIPDVYDAFMVPLLFEPWARDLAKRAATPPPGRVLETAAGSGVVTRALAPKLPDDAQYMVTDLNAAMLERAQVLQQADTRIVWKPADAMALPFKDGLFDVVCCQFGMMFLPDKVAGYREALRVLRPGGRFIFNVWDRIEDNVIADIVTRTAAVHFPDDPPQFMRRTPHGYHAKDVITADAETGGFSGVVSETITEYSTAPDARAAAIAVCQGTPLRNEILDRDPDGLERITDAAAKEIAAAFGTGPISARMQAHVFVCVKQ